MDIYKLNFTKLELEIFLYLCIMSGDSLSQRDIAKKLRVSPTAVSNSVKNLEKQGLARINKTKNINFILFNRDSRKAVELKRAENLRQAYASGLADFLEEKLAGAAIILFGSYSRGEDTVSSDIDIAVIGRKSKEVDVSRHEKMLFRKINIQFYDSWKDMHIHLKNNILNGIVIAGSVEL
ncbi:MAG: nucleotidyltransferase domain-containing protein [Candidatus Woesearchaeota archaeon]